MFVLLAENLGSHHSAIPVSAFRGFAIADPIAPFIVINDGDAKAAWSFTLLHELAHLWLGATGVSGGVPEMQIERFCCDVAGEFCGAAEWRREKDRPKGAGGSSGYGRAAHRLGHAMLDFARRYTEAGALSPVKMAKVLEVAPRSVYSLLALTA